MRDLLINGTDTGVGKTVVAAGMLLALRARGVRAIGLKPAETGLTPNERADSEILAWASGTDEPLAAPLLRLAEPLAPAVAAERAGTALDPARLRVRLQALREEGYTLVVEGAGGLLVPLAWGFTALDLAEAENLEAVLVARAGLGTLNHILLTAQALLARGVRLKGVVLNGRSREPDLAETTNPAALARLLPGVPLVVLPRWPGASTGEAARRAAEPLAPLLA
ncbi:MAG TPA: dethiobiotin synthase [Vicinamibacteria bacterium]|nr:dethiobiotin synthase [Vicinamibacteria bacterium]